jgi:hypothetical protein
MNQPQTAKPATTTQNPVDLLTFSLLSTHLDQSSNYYLNPNYKATFSSFSTSNGKKVLITKCQVCGKGFYFEENKFLEGEFKSITCPACIANPNSQKLI